MNPGRVALPRLGFGAAQLGNLASAVSDEEADAALEAAWAAGIRYFDTAPHYGLGLSERRLGRVLSTRPRDEFVVSTKVGRLLDPTPDRAAAGEIDDEGFATLATHRRRWDFSRDGILRSVEESLTRLGLDRIDVVYLHDPDDHWDAASTTGIAALAELRDQGVVRAIGAGMNQAGMLARFVRECDVDVVMVAGRYTLLDRSAIDELLPLALERGVAVVAAGVYNSGLLSREQVSDGARFDYQPAPEAELGTARALAALCRVHGVSLPAAAAQFPGRHPAVASVVIGMRTAPQVTETVERLSAPIPDSLWAELAEVLE
jgi:D-threo-aldose 1-dehydrogenase